MDIAEHKKKFEKVIEKYNLADKAEEVAKYILKHQDVSVKEFSTLFAMEEEDAKVFLSFIDVGIKFKEKHIDNNNSK